MAAPSSAALLLLILAVGGVISVEDVSPYANVTCVENGYLCSGDCGTLYYCVSESPSSYRQIELNTCDTTTGQYCNAETATCSSTAFSCRYPRSAFQCTGVGYFPDPTDCTQYHVCMHFPNSVPEYGSILDGQCEAGWAYDPLTTTCKYHLTDSVCTQGPVPLCKTVGQNGPLNANPNMYYICLMQDGQLVPEVFECPHGYYYVIGSGCVESTTSSPPVITTPSPPIGNGCTRPGVFPDSENCHRYYICSDSLHLRHYSCCFGFYFSASRNRCVFGFC